MADDLLDESAQAIKIAFQEIPADKIDAIFEQLRQKWGGNEAYIAKRKITNQQKQKAVTEYIGGKPLKDISKDTGVGRATLYRHLKK